MSKSVYSAQAISESTYIAQAAPTTNVGSNASLFVGQSGAGGIRRSLVRHPSIPSDIYVLANPILSLYCVSDSLTGDRLVTVYRCKRNWVEDQATWNIYSTGNNWTSAGAMGAGDYDSTPLGTATLPYTIAANAEFQIPLDETLFKEYINNQATYPGGLLVVMVETAADLWNIHSNDSATEGYRPKLTFDYWLGKGVRNTFIGA